MSGSLWKPNLTLVVYEKVFELFYQSELFVDLQVPVLITLFSFSFYVLWLGFGKVKKALFWAQRVLHIFPYSAHKETTEAQRPKFQKILT